MELARVVVEREEKPRFVHRLAARGPNEDAAVAKLAGCGPATVGKLGLPACAPGCQLQGVETLCSEDRLDHGRSLEISADRAAGVRLQPDPDRSSATGARILTPVSLADAISLLSRKRKLRLFLDELRPTAETSVLDVGADEAGFGEGDGCRTLNFLEEMYPWPQRITALGLQDGVGFRSRYPHIAYVQGDACALPFADGEFDIVFSNAVIEHVGDRARQRLFVSEALRVGRRVFLTTPNRRFPIELHTRLPLVHWLPDRIAHRAYGATGKGFATDIHLLSKPALESLFPGRVRIVNLGLTLVAIVD
jgi:SAM-dependent methyltransferase